MSDEEKARILDRLMELEREARLRMEVAIAEVNALSTARDVVQGVPF